MLGYSRLNPYTPVEGMTLMAMSTGFKWNLSIRVTQFEMDTPCVEGLLIYRPSGWCMVINWNGTLNGDEGVYAL